jgi:TRAP-type mannitol/chloroaromatic compound transport system substrate-binding protein
MINYGFILDNFVHNKYHLTGCLFKNSKSKTGDRFMDRRKFIAGTGGVAGILAASVAPAVHGQSASIRWRLASSYPKALDTLYGAAEVFAKKVGELSGGKFVISTHAAGELMPAFGILDGVQQGAVECGHTAGYYYYGKDSALAIDTSIPFGLNARQTNAWMYEGNGLKLMRELYSNFGVVNFPCGNTGVQMGGFFRKEIKGLEDLKGMKMRISNLGGEVMSRMGVVPQSIPGGEIYQALEKGTIDSAEFVGPYDDLKLGLQKVAKNYYFPAWWEGGPQLSLLINSKAYAALSAENKAIIECAAAYAHTDMLAKYDAKNPAALKELVAGGVKLNRFPKVMLDEAYKHTEELYSELSAKNPNWKKIYADYAVFRRDTNQWFRFAESAYDNYMSGLKL